jgi:hypothetical protein
VDVTTGKTKGELQAAVDNLQSQVTSGQSDFLTKLGDYLGVEGDPPSQEDLQAAYDSLAQQAASGELTETQARDMSILAMIFAVMAQGAKSDNAFRHSMMEANASFRDAAATAGYAAADQTRIAGQAQYNAALTSGISQIAGGAVQSYGAYKMGKAGSTGTTGTGQSGVEMGTSSQMGRARSNAVTSQATGQATGQTNSTGSDPYALQLKYQAYSTYTTSTGGLLSAGDEREVAEANATGQELQTDQQTQQSYQSTVQGIANSQKAPELINAMMTLLQQLHSTEQQIWS